MKSLMTERIVYSRKKKGWNQEALAEAAEVTRSMIGRYETGNTKPSTAVLARIADALDVSVDYLLDREPTLSITADYRPTGILVPVYGTIQAGTPIEAIEDIEDWEEIKADRARGGQEFFALRIKGDSMSPKYEDGDVVIFRKQESCESGQDCAVMVNGNDATFKRVKISNQGITLHPLNPAYDAKLYTNKEVKELPIVILGVADEIRRGV